MEVAIRIMRINSQCWVVTVFENLILGTTGSHPEAVTIVGDFLKEQVPIKNWDDVVIIDGYEDFNYENYKENMLRHREHWSWE